MIFVTVGTNEAPFDRLIAAVDALERDDVVVQHGASARPAHGHGVEFLDFDEMVDHVRSAGAVVMHAGAGSALLALTNGIVPILVPRRHAFGEAVDDHQVSFARRFAERGLAVVVEDLDHLAAAVSAPPPRRPPGTLGPDGLVRDLGSYLDGEIAFRRGRAARSFFPKSTDYSPKEVHR